MDNKPPLSKLQNPIPASVWLEHYSTLPTQGEGEMKTRKTKKKKSAPATNVPASVWFKHEKTLPTDRDVVVNVLVPDIPSKQRELENTKSVVSPKSEEPRQQEKIEPKVEFTPTQNREIDELIESILNLTKSIQEDKLKDLTRNEIKRDNPKGPSSLIELVKKITQDKISSVKETLTVRNLLQQAGVRSAFKGSETILDRVLSYREERSKKKEPSVLGSTILGSSDYAKEKFKRSVSPTLEKIKNTVNKKIESSSVINNILQQSSNIRTTVGSSINNQTLKKILSPFQTISNYSQTEAIKNPNSLIGSIARRYHPNIKNDKELDMARILTNPSTNKEKEFSTEVRSGMRDELLELNQEQLEQLKKMVKAMSKTQEDRFEEKKREISPITTEKKEEKPEEKSLISTLMDKAGGLKGLLGKGKSIAGRAASVSGTIVKSVAPALSSAAPALGVAASGAAGYGVGTLINDNIINPTTEKLTGVKGQTLGSAIYDAVDNVKGWFGNSDADKIAAASVREKGREVVGKVTNIEPVAPKRAEQTQQIRAAENNKGATPAKKEAPLVDARTTVNNQSTSIQYVRPNVKNLDNTFNNLLSRNFSH